VIRLIAALLLGLLLPSLAVASGTIRVAIVTEAPRVELRGTDIDITELGPCETCPRLRWRADVVVAAAGTAGVEADGRRASALRLQSPRPVRINGKDYAGTLDVVRNGAGIAVVNELPLEEYLVGVVRAEVGDRWPGEALRAQAIVARSYAAYQRMLNAARPYHVVGSTADQAFFGRVPPTSPAWDAVRDTAGLVLRWEGQLFPAFYHAESGGYTEDPRTVFTTPNLPALRPVRCQFSASSPHFYWNLDLRLADVAEALRRNEIRLGAVTAIEVAERTPSLRAAWVIVHGRDGSVRLRGNDFRRMLGYETFKSTLFAVAIDGEWAHFSGRGYGHGVGLSQWGARGMAEHGYSARQIVTHYYPGATLGTLESAAR
jgi:stage II sporulation protein D